MIENTFKFQMSELQQYLLTQIYIYKHLHMVHGAGRCVFEINELFTFFNVKNYIRIFTKYSLKAL